VKEQTELQSEESHTAEEERNWEQLCDWKEDVNPNQLREKTGPTDMLSSIRANTCFLSQSLSSMPAQLFVWAME